MASKSNSFGLDVRLSALVQLGRALQHLAEQTNSSVLAEARAANAWFTETEVRRALRHWATCLSMPQLQKWIAPYTPLSPKKALRVGILMAGNIPLVGLHDLICVFIAGHQALIKPSTRDTALMNWAVAHLTSDLPTETTAITSPQYLRQIEAFIGTGTDATAHQLRHYFAHTPHLIRGHKTSAALLTGNENDATLQALGHDLFAYYGQGCRSVTQLWLPEGFDLQRLVHGWQAFAEPLKAHNAYAHNYAYQRAIALMNQEAHIDTGFVLLKEKKSLSSFVEAPTSVVMYRFYSNHRSLRHWLRAHSNRLQCVVGTPPDAKADSQAIHWVSIGCAQYPHLHEYADGQDTLRFLQQIPE